MRRKTSGGWWEHEVATSNQSLFTFDRPFFIVDGLFVVRVARAAVGAATLAVGRAQEARRRRRKRVLRRAAVVTPHGHGFDEHRRRIHQVVHRHLQNKQNKWDQTQIEWINQSINRKESRVATWCPNSINKWTNRMNECTLQRFEICCWIRIISKFKFLYCIIFLMII